MAGPKGNHNRAKGKRWQAALERALAAKGGTVDRGLDIMAALRVKKAFAGDQDAIEDIANRFDGKPAQALEISGDITNRTAKELTNDELAIIAAGGSIGAADETQGTGEPAGVH